MSLTPLQEVQAVMRGYQGYLDRYQAFARHDAPPPRFLVLVSGSEYSHEALKALLKAKELGVVGGLPIGEMRVLSNSPQLKALAEDHGVPFESRDAGKRYVDGDPDKGLTDERQRHLEWVRSQWTSFQPDLGIMAKYMIVLDGDVLAEGDMYGRLLNVHHSLLPAFTGLHALEGALQGGTGWTSATVHFVTRQLDQGPIIWQALMPILRALEVYGGGDFEDLRQSMIPLMREAEVVSLLQGLDLAMHGKVKIVLNEGAERFLIPEAMRKPARVHFLGEPIIRLSPYGPFPSYSYVTAWIMAHKLRDGLMRPEDLVGVLRQLGADSALAALHTLTEDV